jgi:uncharacterized membrane protein YphA (DoxX/SURF4 family)
VRICAPRRHRLQRLFSSFPEGWPGIGLVFLRLTLAINAITCGADLLAGMGGHASSAWAGAVAIAAGLALLIGFLTPFASASITIGCLVMSVSSPLVPMPNEHISILTAFDLAAISIALVLLGPGAFSLDARLFGRREIIIPEGRRPTRG